MSTRNSLVYTRTFKKLTQDQMSDYGFNYRFYQRLESGVYSPNVKTLFRLAEAFGVDIRDFFEGDS